MGVKREQLQYHQGKTALFYLVEESRGNRREFLIKRTAKDTGISINTYWMRCNHI